MNIKYKINTNENKKDFIFNCSINFDEKKLKDFIRILILFLATPSRLFLLGRNIFNYYDYKLYDENLYIYSDIKHF